MSWFFFFFVPCVAVETTSQKRKSTRSKLTNPLLSPSHIYTTLPLTSPEEFLAAHPEHASSNSHDLTVARIQDEHAARQQLEEQRQGLAKRKEALLRETNAKKEELGKLDAELERWIAGESGPRKIFEARERKVRLAEEEAQQKAAAASAVGDAES